VAKPNDYQCHCPRCKSEQDHPDAQLHRQMYLLAGRLNEQQRRWFAAIMSKSYGYGGDRLMSLVLGMHVQTIRRGRRELDNGLLERPVERVRKPGGGRKAVRANGRPIQHTIVEHE
jgi:hypothetical protein